jgi:hypothetical protein
LVGYGRYQPKRLLPIKILAEIKRLLDKPHAQIRNLLQIVGQRRIVVLVQIDVEAGLHPAEVHRLRQAVGQAAGEKIVAELECTAGQQGHQRENQPEQGQQAGTLRTFHIIHPPDFATPQIWRNYDLLTAWLRLVIYSLQDA